MTQAQIKELEKQLWDAADDLRANSNLTASEYKDPLLGLVLLRFAQNRFEEAREHIEANLPINPRTGQKRTATKDDYLAEGAIKLPKKAMYDYLAERPEGEVLADAVNEAMRLIEDEYPELQGILPKNYHELEERLIRSLVRVFNKDAVKKASGDVFGRIYEYFLMKFSMQGAGAQEGGEFFTPPSLVDLIVNFIEPDHGIIHDPACGSGGMFVQSAHFIKQHGGGSVNEAITVYGTEYKSNTTRLAKMNLAIHGIEGKVQNENSFYADPHQLVGKCDFVMANPPFNVDKVDAKNKFLAEDKRLPFGPPLTGKGTIGNANYLWMQYFYAYLNETGRAGFVMASSATDAGNAEKLIRKQLVETGAIDCIVSIGNNFFYTRSLPCHLWFYDRGKPAARQDKILMIDARNLYRVVNSTINDFSPGQQSNLSCIMALYRGNNKAIKETLTAHKRAFAQTQQEVYKHYQVAHTQLEELAKSPAYQGLSLAKAYALTDTELQETISCHKRLTQPFPEVLTFIKKQEAAVEKLKEVLKDKEADKKALEKELRNCRSTLSELNKVLKIYKAATDEYLKDLKQIATDWQALQDYFPDGKYKDIEGLCKIADRAEIAEQDYSLTPGRYVGVAIDIDMDFDYKGRMSEIHQELETLNKESNQLMEQIQGVRL